MAYPATTNNFGAAHSSGQTITSANADALEVDVNALTAKAGSGASTPSQNGYLLTSTGSGASVWANGAAVHRSPQLVGIVGQGSLDVTQYNSALLTTQYNAGVRMRLIELGWGNLQPTVLTALDPTIVAQYQTQINAFVALGSDVVIAVDLGIQYCTSAVEAQDPITDQYGTTWTSVRGGNSPVANIVWSSTVRTWFADYLARLFDPTLGLNFHGRLWAIRTGLDGGELALPTRTNGANPVSLWAYDTTAQASLAASTVGTESASAGQAPPRWSKSGLSTFTDQTHAAQFYNWYVRSIAQTHNWVHTILRQYTDAWICPVTPGGGLHQGDVDALTANKFDTALGGDVACGTGHWWDYQSSFWPSANAGCMNWCSSIGDASGVGNEFSVNPGDWCSAHQHAALAAQYGRRIYGENPGDLSDASPAGMTADFALCRQWGYSGLMWVRQSQMTTTGYATIANLASAITANQALQ